MFWSLDFLRWLNKLYSKHTEMKATQGNIHDYLGMMLQFGDGELVVNMCKYMKNMLEEFPLKFQDKKIWAVGGINLFKEDTLKKLDKHH